MSKNILKFQSSALIGWKRLPPYLTLSVSLILTDIPFFISHSPLLTYTLSFPDHLLFHLLLLFVIVADL